jgi:arylsulfatase A-like enzyme
MVNATFARCGSRGAIGELATRFASRLTTRLADVRSWGVVLLAASAAIIACLGDTRLAAAARPNIVWILVEDMSAHFSCYGEKTIATPEVDRLAKEGTRFERAFVTAPICSTSRSALITGHYQTTIGAQHHRSGRGEVRIVLPKGVAPVTELFRQAGYFTCNGSWPTPPDRAPGGKGKPAEAIADSWAEGRPMTPGKTDYNFDWPTPIYDGADWSARKPGQPFFAQVQLHGGKYRDGENWRRRAEKLLPSLTDPQSVTLPPYYPRVPGILDDWANYLDAVRFTDKQVGEVRRRLAAEGLLDNTVIFFLTDHGISHGRGKQFLYDEGLRVPLVVRGPGIAGNAVRGDLVEHIDLAATSLALAGIGRPARLPGRELFASAPSTSVSSTSASPTSPPPPARPPRDAVFAARDRADETVDHLRSVRTERYKYIRNFLPERPHLQPNAYKDHKPCLIALRKAHADGLLDAVQQTLFAPRRPAEELYDLAADPWEIHNLAADPAHRETLETLRKRLDRWMEETDDRGREPESRAQFASDMRVYLSDMKRNTERRAEIEANIRGQGFPPIDLDRKNAE